MADELPDLLPLADSTQPTDLELAGAQHAADWATRFGRGDTNLGMRNKHNDEIVDYNSMLQQKHDEALRQQIQTGKNAFDFWAKTQELAQKERLHAQDMALRAPLMKAQQDAAVARAEASRKADLLKATHEEQAAKHLIGFADTIQEGFAQGIQPGTKAYQDLAVKAFLANPHADKDVVEHVFGLAKLKADPDEVLAQWNSLSEDQRASSSFFTRGDGTIGFRAKNMSPLDQQHIAASASGMEVAKSREARMQSQFDRKLSDADAVKEDTGGFLSDAARLHQQFDQGSPEYKAAMGELVAAYPLADTRKIKPFMSMAGVGDTESMALRERAQSFREEMGKRSADRADKALDLNERRATDTADRFNLTRSDRLDAEAAKESHQAKALEQHASGMEAKAVKDEKTAIDKEIAAMEKTRHPWRNTTGVFTDKKGVERFGKAELPWEESPVATPELKADYARYQQLKLKRAAIEAGTPIKKFNPATGKYE